MLNNIVIVFFIIMLISCDNTNHNNTSVSSNDKLVEISVDVDKFTNKRDSFFEVDFRKIGSFDTVFIYGPYENLNLIENELGGSFHFVNRPSQYIDDNECLVVFRGRSLDNNYFFLKREIDISMYSKKHLDYKNSLIMVSNKYK